MEHFAQVIAGAEAPVVSAREGMLTLAVIEAIHASASQGVRVELA